jgi:small subunit ribosomal protein S8
MQIKRVSTPGRHVYADSSHLPSVFRGLGTAILSTSRGLMTNREARLAHVGGEVLLEVW